MDVKEKNYKNIISSNILLFVTYAVIILFIFSLMVFWARHVLVGVHNDLLTVCLSLISAILIYYSLHFACKSCTLGNLKKSKLNQQGAEKFLKRMNLTFVLCVVGSVLFCIAYLTLDRIQIVNSINETYDKYSIVSYKIADKLVDYIATEYRESFLGKMYSTLIIESAFILSFLSLIPYQKKVLEKYNK